jgi:hypothetical protein
MNPKLYFASINHNDPLCRLELINWLDRLSETMDTEPVFIAVEASEQVYKELKCQRNQFKKKAKAEFPQLSEAVIEDLSLTIYYEADAYLKAFPNAGIIWLDANRQVNKESLLEYAQVRLNMYRPFLNIRGDILKRISEDVWNKNWEKPPETPLGDPDYGRDFIFHQIIKEAIYTHQGDWAIIIVGASHSAMRNNSVRVLLEKENFDCNVTVLKPG